MALSGISYRDDQNAAQPWLKASQEPACGARHHERVALYMDHPIKPVRLRIQRRKAEASVPSGEVQNIGASQPGPKMRQKDRRGRG